MKRINWFSGGGERAEHARELIQLLVTSLDKKPQNQPLVDVLIHYSHELTNATSTPFVLSQMNVEISHILLKHPLSLTEKQAQTLEELRKLSHIRFGY